MSRLPFCCSTQLFGIVSICRFFLGFTLAHEPFRCFVTTTLQRVGLSHDEADPVDKSPFHQEQSTLASWIGPFHFISFYS